jgi:hypothetical protein
MLFRSSFAADKSAIPPVILIAIKNVPFTRYFKQDICAADISLLYCAMIPATEVIFIAVALPKY